MTSLYDHLDRPSLKTFVQTVSRAFYDPSHVIVLDQLLKRDAFREDDLAMFTGVTVKELARLAGPLIGDGLVKRFERLEHREANPPPYARPINRRYYWIDFKHFSDVVRWRMDVLFHSLDKKLRAEQENKGYICPACKKTYLPLDIPAQISDDGNFLCDVCSAPLVDNEESQGVRGEKDKMAGFNGQTKWIQEGLRKTAEMVFPKFDIQQWLVENARNSEVSTSAIQVDLQLDADQERKAREQARLVEEQRSQNILPAWHLYSTVSGQQTALGIAHAAQAESSRAAARAAADGKDAQLVADERHTQSLEDYYRQRQAGLPSSAPAPDVVPKTEEPASDDDDEAERARLCLASGVSSAKRSRSPSVDFGQDGEGKRWKGDEDGSDGEFAAGEADDGDGGQQVVTVAGVEKAFEDVTEDDQELMTPDEYTIYAEIWQELNS